MPTSIIPWPLSRRTVLQSGALVLLLGRAQLARGANILAVRVWPAKDYTRVTIESDALIKAKQFFVSDPPRLAVDIEGIDLVAALRELVAKVRADDPNIERIRVGQNTPGVVRLVLDLKQAIAPQVFALPPVAAYQFRLILDLYPVQVADPLELLIRDVAQSKAVAAPEPGPDLLGQWIAQAQEKKKATVFAANRQEEKKIEDKKWPKTSVHNEEVLAPPSTPVDPQKAGPTTQRLIIVALDPGHGGEDPGAIGPGGTREKDVVLQIAQLLRERINALPNMRAYLTRDADFFVPLHMRVQKARRVQADLFISIHADAFFTERPQGASVFALSEQGASSSAARWLANKENAADLVGGVNVKVKDEQVQKALFDMSTTAQIQDSVKLGSAVLREMGAVGKLHKGRVEQAAFAVLKAPDIPSVLVETAFISNPDEEAKLRDSEYQTRLADALLGGIKRYFAKNPPLARNRAL